MAGSPAKNGPLNFQAGTKPNYFSRVSDQERPPIFHPPLIQAHRGNWPLQFDSQNPKPLNLIQTRKALSQSDSASIVFPLLTKTKAKFA